MVQTLTFLFNKFFFKFLKLITFIFFALISPALVLLIRIFNPLILIRFQYVRVNRIGHLSTNIELYLCEKDNNINKPKQIYFDIFFYDRKICNNVLFKKWKKKVIFLPAYIIKPIYFLNNIILFQKNKYQVKPNQDFHYNHDIYNLLDRSKIHLTFNDMEKRQCQKFLENCGINKNDKFVCLIVRDSAYLNSKGAQYHSHRDCDIDNFILVSEELTKLGYFVFRMGAVVNKKLISNNKRIFDYATNGMRSELLDLFLCSKCDFCISTSLGLDSVIDIFRRPLIITNFIPFGDLRYERKNVLTIFKHHFSKNYKRNLTMYEIKQLNLGYSFKKDDFENKNIELVENSKNEIYKATLDLINLINNKKIDEKKNKMIDQFNLKFRDLYYNKRYNTEIKTTIAGSFIMDNLNLIK